MLCNGQMLDLNDTTTCDYGIEEEAHALSGINRFNAHTNCLYSVAQHCYIMSFMVPMEFQFAALLHDMQEAFVSDLPTPVKNAIGPGYRLLENKIQREMAQKFGVSVHKLNSTEVKKADLRILATERRDLFDNIDTEWPILVGVKPYNMKIVPWSREESKRGFLLRFQKIKEI